MANIQVVSPVGMRTAGPDLTGLAGSVGNLISEKINQRLQSRALEGDDKALTRLSSRDPNAAAKVGDIFNRQDQQQAASQQAQSQMAEREQAIIPRIAQGYNNAKDKQGYLAQTSKILGEQGFERLAANIAEDAQMYGDDPDGIDMEYEASLAMFTEPEKAQNLAVQLQNRQDLIEGIIGAPNPETGEPYTRKQAVQQVSLIQAGIIPRAQGSSSITAAQTPGLTEKVAQSQRQIKTEVKRGESAEKTERNSIESGMAAAKGIPSIKKSLEILETVNTGGFKSALMGAKNFFGVTGEDEGQLSYNLGKNVLSQLRDTFGAQFTEKDREQLERIESRFGTSTKVNKRLLNQALQVAEKSADNAIDRAIDAGDHATAEEIQGYLDQEFTDEAPQEGQPQTVTTQAQYDALQSGAIYIEDGKRYRKP